MLYTQIGIDRTPDGLERRKTVRREHLAHLAALGEAVVMAGPFMSEEDPEKPVGSLIVYEAESIEQVREWIAKDPYTEADVFETVTVRPWNWLFGKGKKS